MRGIRLAVAAAALAISASTPGLAAPMPGNDYVRFERVLKAAGYQVSTGKDSTGDVQLKLVKDGLKVDLYFYNCTKDRDCMSYQIQAGFDLKTPSNAAKMNEWNRNNRLVRAYIDDEGDPYITVDVSMNAPGGTSDALIVDYLTWFIAMSDRFKEFIGFAK